MCPYPGIFRITASFSPCPVVHIPLDKNALSEKMSKFFLVIGIFVVGRTSASGHNCWHIPKKQVRRFKNWVTLPAKIFQISRSTPPLLHPSKKTDGFLIVLCAATYWKNGIHYNAGNGLSCWPTRPAASDTTKNWKINPSNEGEKTEVRPDDRYKKTRRVIGLFCVFQPWVGGSDWRRTLFNQHRHNMSTWYGMQPYPLMRIIHRLVLIRYNSSLPARIKRF